MKSGEWCGERYREFFANETLLLSQFKLTVVFFFPIFVLLRLNKAGYLTLNLRFIGDGLLLS